MFLDADLEVLSRSQAKYSTYAQQVLNWSPSLGPCVMADSTLTTQRARATCHHPLALVVSGPAPRALPCTSLLVLLQPPHKCSDLICRTCSIRVDTIQVRLEYSHVPHPVYLQARANILRGFERSPQLYFTRHARVAGMEEKARRNLRDEVRRLEGSGRAA
eukprot:scaffold268395_cov33-Tisochrysis_lutea.AAC.3